MPVGPIDPATKRGLSGVEYLSHAARASRAAATFSSRVLSSIPHSRSRCGVDLERARLDDVAADGEERLVDRLDDVGPRENEVVVAPFERLSAEIFRRRVVALDVRPHRAVEDEHALRERVEIRARGSVAVRCRRCGRVG